MTRSRQAHRMDVGDPASVGCPVRLLVRPDRDLPQPAAVHIHYVQALLRSFKRRVVRADEHQLPVWLRGISELRHRQRRSVRGDDASGLPVGAKSKQPQTNTSSEALRRIEREADEALGAASRKVWSETRHSGGGTPTRKPHNVVGIRLSLPARRADPPLLSQAR